MSPTRNHPGSWTEIRLGARAHHNPRPDRTRAPPNHHAVQPSDPEPLKPRPAQIRRFAVELVCAAGDDGALEAVAERRGAPARGWVSQSKEQQLREEGDLNARLVDAGTESFAESLSYFPSAVEQEPGPRRHLSLVKRARRDG